MTKALTTLLIANRGEIAARVIRTASRMGLRAVAVFSDADRNALYTKMADTAVALHGNTPAETYLSIAKILDACLRSGADAVHPGYGFLSENAVFARACRDQGITFVGPDPESIEAMGSKSAAKRLMKAAGVPVLAGYDGDEQGFDFLYEKGVEIGFPLMVKAAHGGGGRGLRLAYAASDLPELLASARLESERAFGSGDLLLERALPCARHVEIQVFGDRAGHVVHMGERDCSVQRRHQKVFEESPSPAVSDRLRAAMGESAVRAASAVNYVGAGTVEFLLDKDEKFYFLEMNTRLQVEHPVTEAVTGLDLVEWQLRVAAGEDLPLTQGNIHLTGHAIEARLYAEDPDDDFRPQVGKILAFSPAWRSQTGETLARVDHGLNPSDQVSPYYDAMLAKVISCGDNREQSLKRLTAALSSTTVFGIKTNRQFLLDCLSQEEFQSGQFDTSFIERLKSGKVKKKNGTLPGAASGIKPLDHKLLAMAAAIFIMPDDMQANPSSSADLFGWSSSADMFCLLRLCVNKNSAAVDARVRFIDRNALKISIHERDVDLTLPAATAPLAGCPQVRTCEFLVDGMLEQVSFMRHEDELHILANGMSCVIEDILFHPPAAKETISDGAVLAPTNGLLAQVAVSPGDRVQKGAPVFTIDAMKLLTTVHAPISGTVSRVLAEAGQQIKARQLIIEIEMDEAEAKVSGNHKEKIVAVR